MNSTVLLPYSRRRVAAASINFRSSGSPPVTAENGSKCALVVPAMMLASVLLPTPGGP